MISFVRFSRDDDFFFVILLFFYYNVKMLKCGFYLFLSKKKSFFYESVYEFFEIVKDLCSRENCIFYIYCYRYVNYFNIKKRIDVKIKIDSKS